MVRSVFQTSTGKSGIVAIVAGLVVAIAPSGFAIAMRHSPEPWKSDLNDIQTIVLTIAGLLSGAGGLGALAGRARAEDRVYSPAWFPGNNRDDLQTGHSLR